MLVFISLIMFLASQVHGGTMLEFAYYKTKEKCEDGTGWLFEEMPQFQSGWEVDGPDEDVYCMRRYGRDECIRLGYTWCDDCPKGPSSEACELCKKNECTDSGCLKVDHDPPECTYTLLLDDHFEIHNFTNMKAKDVSEACLPGSTDIKTYKYGECYKNWDDDDDLNKWMKAKARNMSCTITLKHYTSSSKCDGPHRDMDYSFGIDECYPLFSFNETIDDVGVLSIMSIVWSLSQDVFTNKLYDDPFCFIEDVDSDGPSKIPMNKCIADEMDESGFVSVKDCPGLQTSLNKASTTNTTKTTLRDAFRLLKKKKRSKHRIHKHSGM